MSALLLILCSYNIKQTFHIMLLLVVIFVDPIMSRRLCTSKVHILMIIHALILLIVIYLMANIVYGFVEYTYETTDGIIPKVNFWIISGVL
jgi:hypothetical protein